MGFSGGGSNTLKPHKHSSAVQDGSPLNMVNVTEGSLNAGDIVYSDGNALQRLAVGLAGQQLKVNAGATAPEWFTPVAGGASTAQYTQSSSSFTTNSTSLVSITNYVVTLPTTTAASNDCLCMISYSISISASDAAYIALTKDTTVLTIQRSDLVTTGSPEPSACQFITDSDGDSLFGQTMTAGGNTVTFYTSSTNTPTLSAFSV